MANIIPYEYFRKFLLEIEGKKTYYQPEMEARNLIMYKMINFTCYKINNTKYLNYLYTGIYKMYNYYSNLLTYLPHTITLLHITGIEIGHINIDKLPYNIRILALNIYGSMDDLMQDRQYGYFKLPHYKWNLINMNIYANIYIQIYDNFDTYYTNYINTTFINIKLKYSNMIHLHRQNFIIEYKN